MNKFQLINLKRKNRDFQKRQRIIKKRKEILKQWLMDNLYNESMNSIDLSGLKFENISLDLSEIEAKFILNCNQKAEININNNHQEAGCEISNKLQIARYIDNYKQKPKCLSKKKERKFLFWKIKG